MKTMRVLKLGTKGKDKATGLRGMLTHMAVEMSGAVFYKFQPEGLSKEDCTPLDPIWSTAERLDGFEQHDVEFPAELLGTNAKDQASLFAGMITTVVLHISGCIHAQVQAGGVVPRTGKPIPPQDFDIRRLEGPAIKKMSEAERQQDQKQKPSPVGAGAQSFTSTLG